MKNDNDTPKLPKKSLKNADYRQLPNVRSMLNKSCAVASEIVQIIGKTTAAGRLLDDQEQKNFKLATDLLAKARQLSIQAKQGANSQPITNHTVITASTSELKAMLSEHKLDEN